MGGHRVPPVVQQTLCVCVFECARVCVCARIILFLGLMDLFFSAAFRVLPLCMISGPLRDGGMCDLALNDDDGNTVRRQEKKNGGENHIAAITLFFIF